MSSKAYNNMVDNMRDVYVETAMQSMRKAADELKSKGNDDGEPVDCTVSIDGTWQRRGFSSLNGIVTAISSDSKKCLDYEVLSKTCKACEKWKQLKGTREYDRWKASHDCQINHFGSSGAMKSAGAIAIFNRSLPQHNLRFTGYIGDGDSNSYPSVVATAPYGDIQIKKFECIGHIQKRMGNRLRNFRKRLKSQLLSDGKKISGKGRLTDKVINKMQNYYGLAIRQNVNQLYAMKKSIFAILLHLTENSNVDDQHKCCPRTKDTTCVMARDGRVCLHVLLSKLRASIIHLALSLVLATMF